MIYDSKGNRKYLTSKEREAFLKAAETTEPQIRTFCTVLAYTGARISECLALSPTNVDLAEKVVVIECLKKRRRGIFRVVPIPDDVLELLVKVHKLDDTPNGRICIWNWGRTTAWRNVKMIMLAAGIRADLAKPKALRHTFGVQGARAGVSLNLLKRWLGHSRLETTSIYVDAIGEEERTIAARMWFSA